VNKSLNAVAGESSEPDSDEESSADGGSGSSSGGSGEEEWIEEDDRRRKQRNNSSRRRGTTSPRRDRCPLNRNSNAATGCGCGYSAGGGGGGSSSGGCCSGGGGGCCGGPSCSVRETLERETLCRALEAVDDGKMPVSEVSNLPTLKYGVPIINVSAYRPLSAFKTWEIIEILKYHMTFSV